MITFGAANYEFRMGKHAVTVGQYAAFLNAVAATDTYALYWGEMATAANTAGIAQHCSFGAHTYSVIDSANHPVTWVSW
jgi:formylglycine-generating enzyme